MSGHTKGPWRYVPASEKIYATIRAGGKILAIFRKPISDEDGRLIAAAPRMFDYIETQAAMGDTAAIEIMESLNANS